MTQEIMQDLIQIPSIMDHLWEVNLDHYKFIQPSEENGCILPMYQQDSKASPMSKQMSVCLITLPRECIVPFHLNTQKEKFYQLQSGSVEILTCEKGETKRYNLRYIKRHEVVIPSGIPHALINYSVDPCEILLISSMRVSDAQWEPATEDLILNKHLL